MSSRLLVCSLLLISVNLIAAEPQKPLPPDAVQMLETLPGKTLTLDFVVGRAAEKTQSFRSLLIQELNAEAARHGAEAPHDWTLTAQWQKSDDRREQLVQFSPQTRGDSSEIGVKRYLLTGTGVDATISSGRTDLNFTNFQDQTNYQTALTLNVSQNLWKDAFGQASRQARRAGYLEAEAASISVADRLQDWALELIDVYYRAWVAKQSAFAADKDLERRLKLERILRLRAQRGTSQDSDVLQVLAAANSARARKLQADQAVQDIWNSLVVTLDLPAHWTAIPATQIPLVLDEPVATALAACERQDKKSTLALEAARREAEAQTARVQSAKNELAPEVKVIGSLGYNGINQNDRGATLDETLGRDHPFWAFGVNVSYPLGQEAAQAKLKSAIAKQAEVESRLRNLVDKSVLDWMSQCEALRRLEKTERLHAENFKFQSDRARKEDERYALGRTTVLSYIQSQDDANAAEFQHYQTQAEIRKQAWSILKLDRAIARKLQPAIEAVKGQLRR